MARILGLDIGDKRIGVAISDETNTIARGLDTIFVKNMADSIERVGLIVKQYGTAVAVIGLPLNMNGTEGPGALKVLKFAEELKSRLKIEVVTFDERLSTKQGESMLISADISRAKRKEKIDKLAAQIILQAYLDMKKG